MKTLFSPVAVVICALIHLPVNGQEDNPKSPKPREVYEGRVTTGTNERPEEARNDVSLIRAMREQESQQLEKAKLNEECVTVSDATDRMLYEHEDTVNNFLSVPMKVGLNRYWVTHYSNPRLASHGGVIRSGSSESDGWSTNGSRYSLTRPWGLIGSLNEPAAQAWLFRPSPFLSRGKKNAPSELPKPEAYALNRFEEYALSMLRKGKKLVRWEREDVMLAVGAVRAEAVCLRCHDGAAGDLLGAFTYSYAKTKAVEPDAQTKQILQWNREGQKLDQIAASFVLLQEPSLNRTGHRWAEPLVTQALLGQGIVTAEMLEKQAGIRHHVLQTDLGPVKKPGAAGAE